MHLTHAFLLKRVGPPGCIGCQTPLTVEHILLNFIELRLIRDKYYTCTYLSELFNNGPSRAIVDFINEIGHNRKLWTLRGIFTTLPSSVLQLYVLRGYFISIHNICTRLHFPSKLTFLFSKSTAHSGSNSHIALMCRNETIQTNKQIAAKSFSIVIKFVVWNKMKA